MLFFAAVTRRRLIALVASCALLFAAATHAQETPPEEQPAALALLGSGIGGLATSTGTLPLPYGLTTAGPLLELQPIVARLGGRLETGPLGQSYTLAIGDSSFVLVPGSATLTSGTVIFALSQPPQALEGRLYVPVDLLEQTYGSGLGIGFAWDGATYRLAASQPAVRELPLEVDLVHLQGVSTLVLQFPEAPRYRIARTSTGYDVLLLGDRLVAPPRPDPVDDPWLRRIELAPDRIRLELAPGCQADSYTLNNPFRLVFDVFRGAPEDAAATPTAPREALRRGIRTVVLDPGHGGKETGALGPAGSAEKEIALLIARALAPRLEQALGVKTVLTRDDDVDLALDERSALANQHKADLFVSIHLNSSHGRTARGAETYFLSLQASDQRAADAAAVENYVGSDVAPAGSDDFQLQLLLWDLAQSQHLASSQRLATLIQEELNRQLELKDRGVKQAPFRVLMGAAMPAVLVELGFISTREEEEKLRSPEYRAELVETLVRAIGRFKAEYEPRASAPSAAP